MSELTATQIPKPSDEQAFERCNEILWRDILKDESFKTYGRRGQRQDGVDLTGIREGAPGQIVGVQCKLKGAGEKLTEDEVRTEVAKALTFTPLLSEYIIVTTAPDDAKLDSLALDLSKSVSKDREINLKVRVLGWGCLEREIRRHPRALNAFDPSHTPHGDRLEQKMEDQYGKVMAALHALGIRPGTQAIHPAASDTNAHTALERQINDYADLASTNPETAIGLLQKLQDALEDDATNLIRFRVASNIAACQFELGEEEIAAQGFIAAYDLDPGNPKAIANKAFGLLLQDDWPSLKAFAETQLLEFPDNATLAAHYIQGSAADTAITDSLTLVPEAVRGTPEVTEAYVRWLAGRGGHGGWWDAAIAAHEAYPDNAALKKIYANALLDRTLLGVGLPYGRVFSAKERADIETAISIYEARWPQIRDVARHTRDEAVSVPLNLILAYCMLHQGGKAIAIGEEALARFAGNPTVKKYVATALIEEDKVERALALISELDVDCETVIMRFSIGMATKDWRAVLDLIDSHFETFPEAKRDLARGARVRANVELAPPEGRRSILEAEQNTFQGNARATIGLAQVARIHGFDDLATKYFAAAQQALERGDDGFPSRLSVAQEAIARGEPGTAADMLSGHLPLDRDSAELRLLAQALVNDYPIRDRAVQFFNELAHEVRSLLVFQQMEGILHINRGVPRDAIGPFSVAFEQQPFIDNLMHLIIAHFGISDRDAIAALLQRDKIDALPGPPLDRIDFCHVLLDFGEGARALALGYQVLIDGLEYAEVVMKFFGLILKFTQNRLDDFNGVVAHGVWVRLTQSQGEPYEALVGEADNRPWGEKADPANAFIAKALGLKVGDTFEHVNATTGATQTWTVSEVKPRWLQAFHHLSGTFGQRFPDAQGFASVTMAEGDIEPALELVRHRSEAARNRANLYLVENIPIAFVVGDRPSGSIAFAEYLISIGEGVRVCVGSADEIAEALTLIEANDRSGAVLDALTAWCAAGLGVFSILEERLGPLAIPASELQHLKAMTNDRENMASEDTMSLTYQDGQYIRHIATAKEHAQQVALVRSSVEAIEKACRVEPVVIPDNLSELGERLLRLSSGDAVAPAVLAGQDRLLLCEDMMMRHQARPAFGAKGVWLQTVLISALRAAAMTLSAYSDALVQLAAQRHGFVQISAAVLFSVFERDMSRELVQLQTLCTYIGNKNAELVSHIGMAAEFINRIWSNGSPHDHKVQKATNHLFQALLYRNRGDEWVTWAAVLSLRLTNAPKDSLLSWCKGHSLSIKDIESVLGQLGTSKK